MYGVLRMDRGFEKNFDERTKNPIAKFYSWMWFITMGDGDPNGLYDMLYRIYEANNLSYATTSARLYTIGVVHKE